MSECLNTEAKSYIASAVSEVGGSEVFFVGSMAEGGEVGTLRVVARGNDTSVPAIIDSAVPGDVVIHNHPSGVLKPSGADVSLAAVFGNRGVGFFIVNNDATEVYVVVEPQAPREPEPLDPTGLAGLISPGGAISAVLGDGYELREEQLVMLAEVTDAFNSSAISLIEATTGTGKTMAYLVPAIQWALQNGERVVISTNTINLQEQLIGKDIPLLRRAMPARPFKHSLVKGMGNYVCMLRVDNAGDGMMELFEDEEVDHIRGIAEWTRSTSDGSLSDLPFTPPPEVWDKVRAESESCLRARCPHYSDCFFFKARREMATAEILIANHHVVFSDLAIRGAADEGDFGILPPYRRIVFDEAHHLVDAATSHFGAGARKYAVLRLLRRLSRRDKGGKPRGLLYYLLELAAKMEKYVRKGVLESMISTINGAVLPRVEVAEREARSAFDELYEFGLDAGAARGEHGPEFDLRVTDDMRSLEGWEGVAEGFGKLRVKLRELEVEMKSLLELIVDYESENDIAKVTVELRGVSNKLGFYVEVISDFLSGEDDGFVRWVEGRGPTRGGKAGGVLSGIGLSPLDVSEELGERLYSRCATVVMTSATMSVGDSFEFIRRGIGLGAEVESPSPELERVRQTAIPTPFDYGTQALLAVPADMPEPGAQGFAPAAADLIKDAVLISGGDALVLFTSYRLLDRVHDIIYEELSRHGILVLTQGSKPRTRLLEEFKMEKRSVLFATDSFWEGVDVPGDSLRLVIITRLPFRVPTEPVTEARVDLMERQGRNPFLEYSVPQAVLKFKQGFGRLIRTRTDRGAVLVLDRRIVGKFYGKYFLGSLPGCEVVIGTTQGVKDRIRGFFGPPKAP